ncbi:UPF0600 protein C5orf51 homolog isoform X2 [Pomacea canaliculata]|uniref:UPF0600 protein C5orf51 homolog isoform X2 n=1 Tax=Pomacea canaliculata TaxID=400727 RepID=UPI000D734D65|nr:UPF0600 protein C5orf51 homolog isoform X2 [Pomacea canaliculata]XP_025111201.1 UPF0600 protein C5orf51 homolog isoform X2 [Pomacea canaliculata]XP_025111202.1 UPF0600 protein C5orf51 homolog isoform X2 [Pomacea canaliculata]
MQQFNAGAPSNSFQRNQGGRAPSENSALLDYTYVDETVLVDEEFPQDTCNTRIYNIRELLDEVCEVALQCRPFPTLLEILGTELVECILWRKGALLYMYCHTLQSQDRLKQELAQYKKCLEDGVNFLEDMLKVRQPSSSCQPAPDDTMQLLNQGIFSDTHLLAMIYAGEMCYWYSCAQERGLFHQDDQHDSFTARHRGLKHLNSYLCAVKGPLKTLNWNAEKAEHYVSYLSRGLQQ